MLRRRSSSGVSSTSTSASSINRPLIVKSQEEKEQVLSEQQTDQDVLCGSDQKGERAPSKNSPYSFRSRISVGITMFTITTLALFFLTPASYATPTFNIFAANDTDTSYNSTTYNSTSPLNSTSPITNSSSSTPPQTSSTGSSWNYTSPPFDYPLNTSHPGNTAYISPKWQEAHEKARSALEAWSLDEKVDLTTGVQWQRGRCVGNIPAIPGQDFPGLCLQDSPLGVRFADFVSAFPAGINVASTFDKDLMYQRGYAMGQEFKNKGVHVALGPMTNMGRVAAGGRNWEGFGGDPYLSGWASEMTIKGMQDAGVQACVKHYVGNEQERNRTESSSNIDDRTMREIYTHPFLRAVAADVASVMCAYNLVNNSWACQNSETQNGILKTDFGFQGYIMSDWQATESGVLAVNSGLDMTMPGDIVFYSNDSYFGQNLTTAVNNGSVEMERVDDMAERILAAYYLLDQDEDYPEVSFDSFRNSDVNNSHVDVREDHDELIRHIGASSTVLLKNTGSLPLKKPKSIALIGNDMGPSLLGPNGYEDRGGDQGTLAMGWGSGTAEFPYLVDPLQAFSLQARKDRSTLNWHLNDTDLEGARAAAEPAEVVVVGINADSGEQYITVEGNEGDRNNLLPWHNGTELVLAVAAVNNNTIVVVHSVGPVIMEEWIDHPNITAVLWPGLPGQESGNSLLDVMYGAYNPSGRLPYTIAKRREDYSADIIYVDSAEPRIPQVDYTEKLEIDYRHFLAKNITPRFEFGFGLSYTEFNLTNINVEEWESAQEPISGDRVVGGFLADWLQRPRWKVTADVQNVGGVDGCEVPQLYLEYPEHSGEPPRVLRDFTRINLQPWDAKQVGWTLSQYDVSIWDVERQQWVVPEGEFGVVVGKSCLDEGVRTTFTPNKAGW